LPSPAVGEHGVEHAGHDQADQDQQALQHARGEHGHQRHGHKGQRLHPGLEVVGAMFLTGIAARFRPMMATTAPVTTGA
jgi:hypothetical protein